MASTKLKSINSCPLCLSTIDFTNYVYFQNLFKREFYKCPFCDLIFVNREHVLSLNQQKDHYDFHNNKDKTQGYIKFLMRLVTGVSNHLKTNSTGLDFGSGPYPMLAEVFGENGFSNVKIYDPLYHHDVSVFQDKYDFITLCEVIEHVLDPISILKMLDTILHPGGLLVISTGMRTCDEQFSHWYYIQDITHINFFSLKTVAYIENYFNFACIEKGHDLIIFLKK